jgi:hypothetical protein
MFIIDITDLVVLNLEIVHINWCWRGNHFTNSHLEGFLRTSLVS